MTDILSFLNWFFINVAVPLLTPVALLPLMRLSTTFRAKSNHMLFRSTRDGQLLWTVLAMSASGCHAAAQIVEPGVPAWKTSLAWALITINVLIIALSAAAVLIKVAEASHRRNEEVDTQTVKASVIAVAISATLLSVARIMAY